MCCSGRSAGRRESLPNESEQAHFGPESRSGGNRPLRLDGAALVGPQRGSPAGVLRALHALVKPRGHVVVSTLNRNWKSWLLAIVGAEYVMGLLERGTHTYSRFIRPSELSRWARSADLNVIDIAGLEYDPLR